MAEQTETTTRPSRFVWPPSPTPPSALEAPADPRYWKRETPRPAQRAGDSVDLPARDPTTTARRQIETVWLGLTRPPFADRAADVGWRPDSPGAWCPRCGTSVGPFEVVELKGVRSCSACAATRLPWSRFVRLGPYEGVLREAIHDVKFTRWRKLGRELGRLLGAQLDHELAAAGVDRSRLFLCPVPIPALRRFFRGIDHTLAIARGVRDITGGAIAHALSRSHRPSQVSVSQSQRRRNVAGSMRPRPWTRLAPGATVVVIDDVRTTGATMLEACRAVQRAAKEAAAPSKADAPTTTIWAAVLGVTPLPDRRSDAPGGSST